MSTVITPAGATAAAAPGWAQALRRFNQLCMFDLAGGPRPFKLAWIINFQKGACFPFFALLMWYYADKTPWATSTAAWIYLGLHGSYGLMWLLKDMVFPDPSWQGRCTIASALFGALGLAGYWAIGWALISGFSEPQYPLPVSLWFTLCISLVVSGTGIMMAADAQKFFTLKLQRGLITSGMFRYVRHPNYLGEMMIYGGFSLLAWHWIAALVLAYFWGCMFATNMAMKEASMSRYPQWAAYKKSSWYLIPFVL